MEKIIGGKINIEYDLGNKIDSLNSNIIIDENDQYRFTADIKTEKLSYDDYIKLKERIKRRENKHKNPPPIKIFKGGLVRPK